MPRIYICDTCNKPFGWGPDCWWYGSLRGADNGEYLVFCSTKCADIHKQAAAGEGGDGGE